jgi:hypothetical protein
MADDPVPWLSSILGKIGIGNYTDATGKTITHSDLPPDVQSAVQDEADQHRDVLKNIVQLNPSQYTPQLQASQTRINRLYNPTTRDSEMAQIAGEKMIGELQQRLSARDAGQR